MDPRRALASAALATALTPAVLLGSSGARAASSASPLTDPAGPAWPASASPASWPDYCAGPPPALVPPLDHGTLFNPDDHSDLLLGTPGLPDEAAHGASVSSSIAAGSGWHEFQMTASVLLQSVNSDLADSPHDMKWTVVVANGSGKRTSNSSVQYFNGGGWSGLGPWDGASTKLVTTPFDIGKGSPSATATLRLRFKIGAGTPPGPVYLVEFGAYVDAEQACAHYTFDADKITVGPPESASASPRWLEYAGVGVLALAAFAIALFARGRSNRGP